ncbi:hypothetical protein D9M70_639230 [compost metagenome]
MRSRVRAADAPEAADNFVEDQQDAVLVADFAQTLQVAAGRHEHACRTRNGLDDDRGNGRGIVQGHDAF